MYTKLITFQIVIFLEIRLVICGTYSSDHYCPFVINTTEYEIHEHMLISVTLWVENSFTELNFQFLYLEKLGMSRCRSLQTFPYLFSDLPDHLSNRDE